MLIEELGYFDIDEFSCHLFDTPDTIAQNYQLLLNEGYVENGAITPLGVNMLESHRIDNALILAAGMSTRFVPINYEIPKGLLPVKGEVLIERQIRQLRERGISNIAIVVGYMKEKFEYLVAKYGVTLIPTDTFATRNNHASIYAAKDFLRNTIITSSDLYFSENIFQTYAFDSYYCTIYQSGKTAERGIETDADDRIIKTMYGDKCFDIWVTLGYAFFSERFSKTMIEKIELLYDKPETAGKFWADIQDDFLPELYMYAKRCSADTIHEFDSLEELRTFDPEYLTNSRSSILKKICKMLAVGEEDICNLESLKKVKPSLFRFTCRDNSYICDVEPSTEDKIIYHGRVYYQCNDRIDKRIKLLKMDKNIKINRAIQVDTDKELDSLHDMVTDFLEYHRRTLPLCAAENIISPFANLPLTMGFQERYIMNNTYSFNMDDNFIGCEKLFPFYQKLSDVCSRIFHAKYTDSRPFTGMHCIDMITKTICQPGDKMMILDKEHGGHASVKPVVERLGIKTYSAPYCLEKYDIDYDAANEMIHREGIQYILLAPSDVIRPLSLERLDTSHTTLLYDCSQLMGLIAAGLCANPLLTMKNIIMFGGTHKTFPGPASGLILTNEKALHDKMETSINPKFLRHSQMHQKISLLFALIEFEKFGADYMSHMVHCSNYLGSLLRDLGYDVATCDGQVSQTHQIFIRCPQDTMNTIYDNAYKYEVTLNKKHKQLFNGYGIRLGTQEIARYDWNDNSLDAVAHILRMLSNSQVDNNRMKALIDSLPKKDIHYAFGKEVVEKFRQLTSHS